MTTSVLVIDFDGVLAVPWSEPVQLFPQVPTLLENLSKEHVLALASFNPRATAELRRHGVLHYFAATRAGCNDDYELDTSQWMCIADTVCKAEQIKSLCKHNLKHVNVDIVHFFDDDPSNLSTVSEKLPHVKVCLVDSGTGLTHEIVQKHLSQSGESC